MEIFETKYKFLQAEYEILKTKSDLVNEYWDEETKTSEEFITNSKKIFERKKEFPIKDFPIKRMKFTN